MTKIKAFTLIEVIVAMLLSSMVVALAVLAFQLVGKQFMSFRESGGQLNDLYEFHHHLQDDVLKAELIVQQSSELKFIFDNEKKADYIINESNVIRKSGEATDTFFVSRPVVNAVLLPNSGIPGTDVISFFSMNFFTGNDTMNLEFYKEYPVNSVLKYGLINTIE